MKRCATLLCPSFVSIPCYDRNESSLTWTFRFFMFIKEPPPLPPAMADKITQMKSASDNLKISIPIDLMTSREDLREAVHVFSRNLSDIESRGDSLLTYSYRAKNSLKATISPHPKSAPILAASPSNLPQARSSSLPTSFQKSPWIRSYNTR
jgi:hypothetical protein